MHCIWSWDSTTEFQQLHIGKKLSNLWFYTNFFFSVWAIFWLNRGRHSSTLSPTWATPVYSLVHLTLFNGQFYFHFLCLNLKRILYMDSRLYQNWIRTNTHGSMDSNEFFMMNLALTTVFVRQQQWKKVCNTCTISNLNILSVLLPAWSVVLYYMYMYCMYCSPRRSNPKTMDWAINKVSFHKLTRNVSKWSSAVWETSCTCTCTCTRCVKHVSRTHL